MSDLPPLTEAHFRAVCRPGAGAETCRYLTAGPLGILCEKHTDLAPFLDRRAAAGTMAARGDNCEGRQGPMTPGRAGHMSDRVFICDGCGARCISDWPEAAAEAELARNFPGLKKEDAACICEACFTLLMAGRQAGPGAELEDIADTPAFRAWFGFQAGAKLTGHAKPVYLNDMTVDATMPDLTPEHFRKVCRAGQGALTCRYAATSLLGITCGKSMPTLRATVDARAHTMRSKGDNCPGRKGLIPGDTRAG